MPPVAIVAAFIAAGGARPGSVEPVVDAVADVVPLNQATQGLDTLTTGNSHAKVVARICRALCHGVARLPLMRRILLGAFAAVLLLAVGTRAADALGVGGVRLRCGCVETCWCKRQGLTVFRWVTPRRWHHIGLTADEKQSRQSQT